MDVVVTITQYQNHLKAIGYAEPTMIAYKRNLERFKKYLTDLNITDLRTVTRQTITGYQSNVMAESIAMESKALKIRPVKRLFEYLMALNLLLINPAEGIVETCRKNRNPGYVLTDDEIQRIMDQPNLSLTMGIRNRAILEVMYATGIRINELVSLEVYHADLKDKVLYIRKGKGRKERVVPLGSRATTYLKEYLEKIRPRHAKKNPRERTLFLTHSGKAIRRGNVQGFIRTYRLDAGIKRPVSPHAFRRTCATHMLRQGADIRYIQKLLGHTRLSTTQVYTRIMPADVKKTHAATHPNNREDS